MLLPPNRTSILLSTDHKFIRSLECQFLRFIVLKTIDKMERKLDFKISSLDAFHHTIKAYAIGESQMCQYWLHFLCTILTVLVCCPLHNIAPLFAYEASFEKCFLDIYIIKVLRKKLILSCNTSLFGSRSKEISK